MKIGVPQEVKILEGRVALVPQACAQLLRLGHQVFVQSGAGVLSGYTDDCYTKLGVTCLADADTLYAESQLIVKVKEPSKEEYHRLRADHILFCYLHLAASAQLLHVLLEKKLTAIAFETVEENGLLPLLAPMSHIAGRLAVQIGAHLLHAPQGGKGVLLGGLAAAERGHVVVLGAGAAGGHATRLAAQSGARVTVFDQQMTRLQEMVDLGPNVTALFPYEDALYTAVTSADLLIGAVLITGAQAPRLVSRAWVADMQAGSVIVDIAVDQGGCIETIHPTTYRDPTYIEQGVVHFAVTNMPGAVPRSSSQVLSAAITPYVSLLAAPNWEQNARLQAAINVRGGRVLHPGLLAGEG